MKKALCFFAFVCFLFVFVGCDGPGGDNKNYYDYYSLAPEGDHDLEIKDNEFIDTSVKNTSAFALDTSTAGYANIRRMINAGVTIPKNAVKIEEMVNYFRYDYLAPNAGEGLAISAEIMNCPWNATNKLITIGVKAEELEIVTPRKNNLVFLLTSADQCPLIINCLMQALQLFVETLDDDDTVSIVTYASGVDVRLNGAKVLKVFSFQYH